MISKITANIRTLLLDLGLFIYWHPVRWLFQCLPQRAALFLTGVLVKTAAAVLLGLRRRLSRSALAWLPAGTTARQSDTIAARGIANYLGRRLEELYLGKLTQEETARLVHIEGRENLDESVQRGKGTIILLSHFGSLLLPLPALGYLGYQIYQLAGPPTLKHHRPINATIFRIRERAYARLPVTFLRTDLHLKQAVKVLRNNDLLAMAIDGREGHQWLEVQFLDKRAFFSPGPLRLAMTTGATIVPTFMIRQADQTHRLVFGKPLSFPANDKSEHTLQHNLQHLVNLFDKYVRRYPCHAVVPLYITEQRAQAAIINQSIFA